MLAVSYPVALAVVWGLFRVVGERWWVTGVGLYLPRAVFLLPLAVLVPCILWLRLHRLLPTQIVAALVAVFPLMGFVLPSPGLPGRSPPAIRVLSANVDSCASGVDAVADAITALSPDLVIVQELFAEGGRLADRLRSQYPAVHLSTQFLLASRFPIRAATEPDRVPYFGKERSPRFMRYVVDTPLGPIAVYNVHPQSPRGGFYALRGHGLRREILSGRLLSAKTAPAVQENAWLRTLQVEAIARLAARETYPVVIAGDTNLPSLSAVFGRYLSDYQDGFREAGWGLGYTYPTRRPWMRLDRILASRALRFLSFQTACSAVSDHSCVVAELASRR